jgi:hypothetical protein
MNKIPAFLAAIVFLISGCTFQMEVLRPGPPTVEVSTPTALVPSPTSTLIPTVAPLFPSPTPVPAGAQFFNARFTLDPNTSRYQNIFPTKTKRIYAVWEYRNMRDGMVVRRDWYHNDKLWISREEPWDFAKYGANGTMRDISVYELDAGLPFGVYRFELYIDSKPQPIFGGVYWPTFTISPNEFRLQVASPNGSWTALVHDPTLLSVIDPNGNVREMYSGKEIANLVWFPDSQHLLFVDRDRSAEVIGTNRGIRDQLWILDLVSRETHLLHESDSVLGVVGGLVISPDGRYAVSTEGSGDVDACFVSLQLLFFERGGDFQSVTVIRQEQFGGLPNVPDSTVYPDNAGTWQSSSQFAVPLKVTCVTDDSLAGPYLFDLANRTAVLTR